MTGSPTAHGLRNARVCVAYRAPGNVEPIIAGKSVASSMPGTIACEAFLPAGFVAAPLLPPGLR